MWIKNLASLLLFEWLFCLFVRTSVESWFISTGAPLPSQRNLSEGKLMLQNFHISLIVHWDGSFLLSHDHFARLSGSLLNLGSLSLVPTLIPKRFSRRTINVSTLKCMRHFDLHFEWSICLFGGFSAEFGFIEVDMSYSNIYVRV